GEGRAERLVDVHRAALDLPRDGTRASGVPAVDRGVQPVLALVGAGHGVRLVAEAVDRDDRAEALVPEALHARDHALEHRRLVEVRPQVRSGTPPGEHAGALLTCVLDVAYDGVELVLGDEGPHVDAPL